MILEGFSNQNDCMTLSLSHFALFILLSLFPDAQPRGSLQQAKWFTDAFAEFEKLSGKAQEPLLWWKTVRKRTRNRYSFVALTLFTNTFEWVSTTSCKCFFSIKEPNQDQKYCNLQKVLNYWQCSVAAGCPPDFSAHPSVAGIHNKIKQMEAALYIKGNVDRLLLSVILIFLSTTFCKKKKSQESLWLPSPVNDT